MNKKIVFIHVPKSGGNTFNFALKRLAKLNNINFYQTGAHQSLPNFSLKYFERVRPRSFVGATRTDGSGIYSGHFVFSNECKKFDNFILIRDVYKTFFSCLYASYFRAFLQKKFNLENMHYIKNKIDLNLEININDISTIKKLIENNLVTSNALTKTLAGIPFEKYFFVKKDQKITNEDYEAAIKNINYFKLIGNIDEFDLFIKSFLNIYKFNLDSYNSHMNVANYDRNIITDMTEKLYQEISDYNYYDIKLFIRLTTLIKTKNEPY